MFPLPDPSHLSILPTSCWLSLSSPLSIQTNIKIQKRRPKHTNKQNPNKTKKCQNVTQTSPKNYRVCFVLANFSWTWDLPWNVLDIPSDSLLEKTYFPFANRNQLKLSSCIGVGLLLIAGTPPPPSSLNCASPGQAAISVSLYMHQPCCVLETVSLKFSITSGSLSPLL